jgi:hypothetical protein
MVQSRCPNTVVLQQSISENMRSRTDLLSSNKPQHTVVVSTMKCDENTPDGGLRVNVSAGRGGSGSGTRVVV